MSQKRGRPITGTAMTSAERQKAYRNRLKLSAQPKQDTSAVDSQIEELKQKLAMEKRLHEICVLELERYRQKEKQLHVDIRNLQMELDKKGKKTKS